MTLVEDQHRLALEQLRRAGEQPVSLAALRAAGFDAPAALISELELNGHAIERVYEHGRVVGPRLIQTGGRRHSRQPSPSLVVLAASIGAATAFRSSRVARRDAGAGASREAKSSETGDGSHDRRYRMRSPGAA